MAKQKFKCPAEMVVALIGGKWKAILLYNLRKTSRRFGELQKVSPGINRATLTRELKDLEASGLVRRAQLGIDKTAGVEYSLTSRGESLKPVLYAMIRWGIANKDPYILGEFGMASFNKA